MRFVVTEIHGKITTAVGSRPAGMSCHVIDTAWNHRLIATYRTEDRPQEGRYGARQRAARHAERLNASC